jgi:ABC-2 type transport system ATP-binding protein
MKQRLAVGATLLRNPDVIVLDEPANGLDPAGIKEIRTLMRDLAAQGKTVFVSSHQLGEVQQTCDVLTIINKGRVIRSGSVADVVNSVSRGGLRVTIDRADEARTVLVAAGLDARAGADPNTIDVDLAPSEGARITEVLAAAGLYLRSLEAPHGTLEAAFLELTAEAKEEQP